MLEIGSDGSESCQVERETVDIGFQEEAQGKRRWLFRIPH